MDGAPLSLMVFRDLEELVNDACADTFGEDAQALLLREGDDPVAFAAIFSNPSEVIEQGGVQHVIASKVPVIEARLSEVDPVRGDRIELAGKAYLVDQVHPDGYGMVKLILQETT
jgi:hypothetical protein